MGSARRSEAHRLATGVDIHGVEHGGRDGVFPALKDFRRLVRRRGLVVIGWRVILSLERDGIADLLPGRVEVLLGDGDLVHVAREATFDDLGLVQSRR